MTINDFVAGRLNVAIKNRTVEISHETYELAILLKTEFQKNSETKLKLVIMTEK